MHVHFPAASLLLDLIYLVYLFHKGLFYSLFGF